MRSGNLNLIKHEDEENKEMTQEEKDKLEDLVDRYTLITVLEALESICYEKAQHIHTNYPDQDSNGQIWHDNGDALAHVLPKIED